MPAKPSDRQDYNTAFLEALDQLNADQRQAVDQIDGPVMVIAGPGTGKTHLLAARIGRILLDTDTQAANILCLTFTDAAVIAMRNRLLQFIGPEAHRVPIYTFHSFCNHIIQDNLEVFGRQELEPISELERIELIRDILGSLPPDHLLKVGLSDIFFYEKHLARLFERMKMEDWSAERVKKAITAYLDDLPQRPEYIYQRKSGSNQKGDPKTNKIDKEAERMAKLNAAVELYPVYEEAKYRARRYDYTDMILWVLRAFEEEEYLLRNYQERYQYLLVDEYQDTNGSQNQLIRQLASYWELPNVFIVGDDDQSIYEFQGARLKNLSDFYFQYLNDIELVMLQQNYRSTAAILEAARQVIQHNALRIIHQLGEPKLEKQLFSNYQAEGALRILEYPNQVQEVVGLFEEIKTLHEEGYPLGEVAVIYAKHAQVERLVELLERARIPYHTRRRINVLDTLLVRKILKLLDYFRQEMRRAFAGEPLLFEILHFDFLGLSAKDLAHISWHLNQYDYKTRPHWREFLRKPEALKERALENPGALLTFGETLDRLLKESVNLSLPAFLEQIYNQLQVISYSLQQSDRVEQLQILSTLLNFAKSESRKKAEMNIDHFLNTIQKMQKNRIKLPLETGMDQSEALQLVTAHSSKGLEFERVYLLDVNQKAWEPKGRNNSFQFTLPDTLTFSGEEDAEEARRRLFYVAITRAKSYLQLSYALQDEKGKDRQRARFVDELMEAEGVDFVQQKVSEAALLEAQVLELVTPPPVIIERAPPTQVDQVLDHFRLSISALNTFLRCPLSFYYRYILQVPVLMSEAAAYGNAMHQALQRLFLSMQASRPRIFPGERDFIQYFEQEMQRAQIYFSAKAYPRYLQKGRHSLRRFYQENYGRWSKRVVVEYTVRTAELDGVPLTGTIDKIEFEKEQRVHLVDYKTGRAKADKLKRPTEKKPEGGNYWRQLVFYKLLYEHFDQTGRIARRGSIVYLDPDRQDQLLRQEIEFDLKDTTALREMVKDTYARIRDHDFYQGCGEDNCHWCNFVRDQQLGQAIYPTDIEELDD
ncbi:MAG TPA: ATP-dependent DNA helicase [Saprospiraceae bacterium]|nr:ATP-dependent DNA helicase [Saprospiraceae bacterium]